MSLEDIKSPLPPRKVSTSEDSLPEANEGRGEVILKKSESVQADSGESLGNSEESKNLGVEISEKKEPEKVVVSEEKKEKKGPVIDIKKILIVLGVLLVLGMGAFFIFGKKDKQEEVVLNYWGLWEDEAVINGIIANFERENPKIKVVYKKNQKTDYRTRLKGRLGKDPNGAEVPDIFRIHSSWVPMFEGELARVPNSTVKKLEMESDFHENYKRELTIKGQFVGIPLMYDGLAMFYNKDLIDAAQIEIPKSWWDLEKAAVKLTVRDENDNIKVAGAGLGTVENVDHWSDIVGLMMKQNGVDPKSEGEASDTKIKEVLTFYSLFSNRDKVWDSSLPNSTQMFANGKLGFYFGPSWRVFNIEEMNPNLNFEVVGIPQLPVIDEAQSELGSDSSLTNINWSSYWFEGVNSNSKNQKEAWMFLEYLASKENLEKMYLAASQIRSFGEIYPRKSMLDQMKANRKTAAFATGANTASGWYLSSRTFDDGVNDEMSRYFGNAINGIVIDAKTPESVMPDLRNGINQLVRKYNL